ncbi:SCO family protein [Hymenobacter latericus]|uniref:SCO family protein n=1 Tax=Hymenobacter sp. YIM 151858-1 TaxID=2987688 RepID=UPI0022274B67|nr:SCO family protein [Hymenobacter sp. YIM 151858-1]UYZ59283.1 SCO family protein [Hymenobacter sp. YIM 151858-1]
MPVLAFLFLYSFGTNHFALRTFYPLRVDSTQVGGKWQRDTVFHRVGYFRLQNQSGQLVTAKNLEGNVYVASFFATNCADVCPRLNSQLQRVQEKFRKEPRLKLLSFSVDPERDSVAALAKYAEQYGAIAGKWYFLTGAKDSVARLAMESYKLADAGPATISSSGGLVNSPRLVLVDRDKHIRGVYDGLDPKDVDRLMTEIRILLYTYDHD